MALTAYTPTVYINDTAPPQDATNLNKTEVGLEDVTDETILHASRIGDLEAPVYTAFTPQSTPPIYAEGQVFYNNNTGTLDVQGKYSDVTLQVGREQHMEVVNNTIDVITNGSIVTQSGVVSGVPAIKLAIADTFDNARILGIVTHDIAVGATGIITTFGEVNGLDTLGVTIGVPVYLSDTVAGTFVETPPNIISRVGGVFVADALNGKLFVYIINNKNLPSVFGGMQGQTTGNETYSLTTTEQDIVNYDITKEVVVTVDALTGEITIPNDGEYRMHFNASITFTSTTSTRSVTIEYYDVTGAAPLFSHVKNIPRDATEDGISFSFPTDETALDVNKLRIKSSVAMNVTFTKISFDMESVNLR